MPTTSATTPDPWAALGGQSADASQPAQAKTSDDFSDLGAKPADSTPAVAPKQDDEAAQMSTAPPAWAANPGKVPEPDMQPESVSRAVLGSPQGYADAVKQVPGVGAGKIDPATGKVSVHLNDPLTGTINTEKGAAKEFKEGLDLLGPDNFADNSSEGMRQTAKGYTKIAGSVMSAAAPLIPAEMYANPKAIVPILTGITAGTLSGAAAQKATKALGFQQEYQDLAQTIFFFLPSAAGVLAGVRTGTADIGAEGKGAGFTAFGGKVKAGVGATPEAFGAGVQVGGKRVSVNIPRGGAPAEAAPPALPSPAEVSAKTQADSALAAMLNSNRTQAAAAQIVKGVPPEQAVANVKPPPPAPPPMPSGMAQGELRPETVSDVAKLISFAPAEQRGQLVMEAHENLAKWISSQGRVLSPDGQVHIVKNPEQAAQLAAKFVNDAVAKADIERNEAQKAQQEQPEKPAVKPGEAPQALQPAPAEDPQERLYQRARTLIASNPDASPALLQHTLRISPAQAGQLIDRYKQDEATAALPTVGSKEEPVVEESRATVDAQVDALKAGTIHTVMIPQGSKYIPPTPPGIYRIDIKKGPGAGTYLYDPKKGMRASIIKEAAANGTHGDLLGHLEDKQQIANAPATAIVQASKPDGTPIQDSAVTAHPEAIEAQAAVLAERHPGADITVKHPQQVLDERVASQGGDDFSDLGAQHADDFTDLGAQPASKITERKGGRGEQPEQPEGQATAPKAFVDDLHSAIAEGHSDATLIPWEGKPVPAIAATRKALEAEGWEWNGAKKHLEKDGWSVWFRSQGELSAPIAQWNRLDEKAAPKEPAYKPKAKVESTAGEAIEGRDGKDTKVLTPSQKLDGKYKLAESADLITSHHPLNFKEDPDYPTGVQERDYQRSKEAQARVIEQEQNHDPAYTINTNPDAVNGPSIITPDGIVLGGNSRAMSIMRIYHNQGADNVYRKALREQAADFGFTPEQVDAMKAPMLVREIARPSSDEEMRRIGSELNKSMTGSLGVSEKAVSAGKNITPETLHSIAEMLEAMGDNTTLRQLMGERGNEILKMLVKDGAITDRERPQFMDAKGLSEEGKTFVERALMGSVVDDSKLMDATPKGILNKLEGSLGSLARVSTRSDEWNLLPLVRAALGEHADIAARGISVEDHLGQTGMFSGPRDPVTDAIVRKLAEGQKVVRAAFKSFATDSEQAVPGQVRLLGPDVTAFDAFNHAFGTTLSEKDYLYGLQRAAGEDPAKPENAAQENARSDQGVSGAPASNAGKEGAGVPEAKPAAGADAGRVEQPTKFKYGNTQADIPAGSDAAKALATARGRIDKADLAPSSHGGNDEGLEDQPHITLRYGLKGDDTAGIRAFLGKQAPFEAKLGRTDAFPPSESSDGAAPIIAPIESADLHRIEAELDKHGDFIDRTFPDYKPHATVAYVKPETVAKYKGMTETEGKTFTVRSISISNRDGSTVAVPLRGSTPSKIEKGATVKGIDKHGVEREGTVKHTNALITRIVDDEGRDHNLSTKKVTGTAVKEPEPSADLATHLYDQIAAGEMPKNNLFLRAIVGKFDGKPATDARMKEAQEALEAAIVRRSRDLVSEGKDQKGTFDSLVKLYESQPNLNVRTTTSITNQAYSTPAPLAYVASKLAGIGKDTFTYEPTAGNGMLLIGADPKNTRANELNPERAAALKAQGFQVTEKDATRADVIPPKIADAVIANPPFGSVKENGSTVKVPVDGYKIGQIDHLIAARALDAMKDDGRATLILGADKVTGGQSEDSRVFFNWLYSHYRVVSHFEVDGKLYGRQGASWPVRVITVAGREASKSIAPQPSSIGRVDTWEGVYERLNQGLEAAGNAGSVERPVERPTRDVEGAVSKPARIEAARPDRSGPEAGEGRIDGRTGKQPGPVSDRAEPQPEGLGAADGSVRPDIDVSESDRLEKERPEPEPRQERPPVALGHLRNDPLTPTDNEYQVAYTPSSSKKDVGVLIPTNMRSPLIKAMRALEDVVGDIDKFTAKELGYKSIDEMHDALMGLQVDSVAAAIQQIKQGKAVIIADQTGIGKGRQAAAMLRWALKNGKTPVFITKQASLFSDMYGDLLDIGSKDFQPLIVNKEETITKPSGEKAFGNNKGLHSAMLKGIANSGRLPVGKNSVFLTYSQVNVDNTQRNVLRALAQDAVIVMDESHNAGGDSATGEFLRELLKQVHGVTYLSATYAKRPDNMPLYFKTDMSEAIDDKKTIMSAMEAGGLPLQTVVSNNLVQAGQMFRRERSYDGVEIRTKIDTAHRAEHEQMSDEATKSLRAIVEADRMFHENYFKELAKQVAKEGKRAMDIAGNQASKSVNHTEFSSVVHNFVRQMLLGIKADTGAQDAIDAIGRGEKPLVAVDNTMGSFLEAYVGENGVKDGQLLKDFDYRTVLSRALDRTRYIMERDEMGNDTKRHIPLSELDPLTASFYKKAQDAIDQLRIDLPVSPIDWIRMRLEKAGHSVSEITGRDLRVDYTDPNNPRLSTVPLAEQNDKVLTTRRFNDGRLDSIILNVSGSTGISLHASERFTDQRQRHMIVAQPAGDINTFMQMLGRIHRTGQVRLPRYTMLSADLPSEKRPTAILSKKMKSLNANTSSNTESATSVKVADMLNKYGDEIVNEYLRDNLKLAQALDVEPSGGAPDQDFARKVTGRLALMPVKVQHAFYNDVETAYNDHIAYLNETGQNELEPRTLDFDAKETKSQVMYQGKKPGTPFGGDAVYGEYSIKSQGKPLTSEEVTGKITETLGGKNAKDHSEAFVAGLQKQLEAYQTELRADGDTEVADRAAGVASVARDFIRRHQVGSTMRIDLDGDIYSAAVTDVQSTHKGTGNPFALSKIRVRMATTGPHRFLSVPATQLSKIEVTPLYDSPARIFSVVRGDVRDEAKIITGNLLGAYGELQGARGRIINFSKADGTTEQGILLPKTFDVKLNTRGDYRMTSAAEVAKFLRKSQNPEVKDIGLTSRDGNVRVVRDEDGTLTIVTAKSKARGAEYFLDKKLLAAAGAEFVSRGNTMRMELSKAKEIPAIDALMNKTALYAMPGMADEARGMSPKGDDGITYRHAGIPLTPEMLKQAAPGVHAFLSDKADKIAEARSLHEGLYDLDSQDSSDVLRAMRMVKAMPGTAADEREIYHAIEDPALPLTAEQRGIRERYIDPIRYDAAEIRRRLNGAGLPVADFDTNTYNHRIVKDRGGLLDRVMHGEAKTGGGGGNKLNKRASSTKQRTMMAIESKGVRRVVSIKNGRVTAWHDKVAQDLGPMRTKDDARSPLFDELGPEDSGRVFIDKTGREWKVTQATTKEIEANTLLRYHQNAMLSAVTDWLELRRHERALDFLTEFKAQPQFDKIGMSPKHMGEVPKGWQPTKLPLFRGYYFEPRTAEVLDWYAERMQKGDPNILEKINNFLTSSLFINPLVHTPNLLMHWITEKGVTGWANPIVKGRQFRAMVKAIHAVAKRNDDFLAALDVGGALQSQRFETRHFAQTLMDALGDKLEKDGDLRTKVAAALGYANPFHLLEAVKNFSNKVTWYSNDLLFLQSAYEKEAVGMPLKTALHETGKHIPDYRLPTRIFDSRTAGKFMDNRLLTAFSSYHYGMLKSYGKLAKSLLGVEGDYDHGTNEKGEPTNEAGRTRDQEKGHAFNILAMMGLMGVVILPALDELLKKVTGNPDAEFRRAGSLSAPYDAYMVAKGEMTVPDAIQRIITPGIGVKALGETVLNKDIRTGKRIYNPGDSWGDIAQEVGGRVSQSFGPSNEFQRATRQGALKEGLSLAGVGFHKHGAIRIAQMIASEKAGSAAMSPEQGAMYKARQEALDAFHADDPASAQKIMSDAGMTAIQRRNLTRAAMGDELLARVHSFSVAEVRRVMEHADEDERRRLMPVLRQKIARAHNHGQKVTHDGDE